MQLFYHDTCCIWFFITFQSNRSNDVTKLIDTEGDKMS